MVVYRLFAHEGDADIDEPFVAPVGHTLGKSSGNKQWLCNRSTPVINVNVALNTNNQSISTVNKYWNSYTCRTQSLKLHTVNVGHTLI